jgi:hypothetical protein
MIYRFAFFITSIYFFERITVQSYILKKKQMFFYNVCLRIKTNMNATDKLYQILFFALLSINIAALLLFISLFGSGYFTNTPGFCKITQGTFNICKESKRNSCKNEKGVFFKESKDCNPNETQT